MMLGPAARMAASSTAGDEEEKTAQLSPAVAKAGRRAGRDRTATTPSNKAGTGNFMSSPRNQADSTTDDDTLLKPSRRAPPPSTAEESNSPPLSPTATPQQKTTRGRAGDSLASEAEAAMAFDEPTPPAQPKTAGWGSVTTVEDTNKANAQSPSANQPSQQPAFGRRNAATGATADSTVAGTKAGGIGGGVGGKHDVADEITDITDIPDLEDEGKQDITLTVAANTHARSHTVQALNELDRQLEGKTGVGGAGGVEGGGGMPALLLNGGEVDVSLLLGVLCGVTGVDEGEGVWEFDALFSEVSSDMYAEMEHQDLDDGAEEGGDGAAAAGDKGKAAQSLGNKRPSITTN